MSAGIVEAVGDKAAARDLRPKLAQTIEALASQPRSGLIVLPDLRTTVDRDHIIRLGNDRRVPGLYPFRQFVSSGGLMSYGVDSSDLYRRSAAYVDRILRGEKAGDLPFQQPTKYELIINLKVAKELGLTVPPSLLATADEVIE
jgi:putative tryptophan/tyrosine transport system substrate-binding protein